MAYTKVSLDNYNEHKQIVVRLKRYQEPFAYSATVSLESYEKAVENVKILADAKNAALEAADAQNVLYKAACAEADKQLIAFRACIGGDKGKSSDAFVDAGGTRQSEIVAAQQQAREEKRKADEAAKVKAAEEK